jgi:hypothetical protein
MGGPSSVFTGLWFGIYLGLPLKKCKIMSWKKKEFEDIQDFLVSFRLYFVMPMIAGVSLPYTICYYKYMWY